MAIAFALRFCTQGLNFTPNLVHMQSPVKWVPRALFLGGKGLGREVEHSLLSHIEIKNTRSYTSSPTYVSRV